ncbi:MAG: DNA helicase-4 [Oleiphilaceae bacterium]
MESILQLKPAKLVLFWRRLMGISQQVDVSSTHINIINNGTKVELSLADLYQLNIKKTWFSSRLELAVKDSPTIVLKGYNSQSLKSFSVYVVNTLLKLMASSERWQQFSQAIDVHKKAEVYLSSVEWKPIAEMYQLGCQFSALGINPEALSNPLHQQVLKQAQLLSAKSVSELGRQLHNQQVVPKLLSKYGEFFDNIEKLPLTANQRLACVTNDDHNLVIAGAGTGKTATLVGKAGFLVEANLAKANNVLLLAFGNKAALEMNQRIQDRLPSIAEDFKASTFHALGNMILANHFGYKKAVTPFVEQPYLYSQFINQQLTDLANQDVEYKALLVNYFLSLATPAKSELDFDSIEQYQEFLSSCRLITLKGEWVKSVGELRIANFLTLNGVDYEYEANYLHDTRTVARRQYQPDFYLPKSGLYIEYLGLNERNETAPFVDQKTYLESLEWKRNLHLSKGTQMAELYSYQLMEGVLPFALNTILDEHDVNLIPIELDVIFNQLREENTNQWQGFIELIQRFLGLFKDGSFTIDSFNSGLNSQVCDIERTQAFVSLFEPVYNAYQTHLKQTETVDFSDMIAEAIDIIGSGHFHHPYTHILVDEFQDISVGRARLLKALLLSKPNMRLFAVGDDWQSIYRFNGADIALFTEFNKTFSPSTAVPLDKTFRFNDKLHSVSSRFVSTNPKQIKKKIHTHTSVSSPALRLVDIKNQLPISSARSMKEQKEQAYIDTLYRSLSTFNRQANRKQKKMSVLIIGRYRQENTRVLVGVNFSTWGFTSLDIVYVTAHASKGLEADYVVLFGIDTGSFPSSRENDELIDLVLPIKEDYLYAEERRLFYVALTRAKHFVYVLFDSDQASPFLTEINQYGRHFIDNKLAKTFDKWPCTQCDTGVLRPISSRYNKIFYKCSLSPACDEMLNSCKHCNAPLKSDVNGFRHCLGCDEIELGCLRCGIGTMVARCENDPNRETFYGCNRFKKGADDSCGENIRVEAYEQRIISAKSKIDTNNF